MNSIRGLILLVLLHLDLNPAAQGSSLTEGKRGKRSKKANGESNGTNGTEDGGRSSDNDSNDQVVEAPNKLANENVSMLSLIMTHCQTCFSSGGDCVIRI
jgi:hypothetical protein